MVAPEVARISLLSMRPALLDPEQLASSALARIKRLGGKSGAKTTAACLFLLDWAEFQRSKRVAQVELFPVARTEAEQLTLWLAAAGKPTAADRVAASCVFLCQLGFTAPHDAAAVHSRPTARP
eukprot:4088577-Prymnesium_polylepis.1